MPKNGQMTEFQTELLSLKICFDLYFLNIKIETVLSWYSTKKSVIHDVEWFHFNY